MPRANETRNGHRHDSDRTRAGDEHVFTDHVEGEGGMRGIPKRIQNRRDVIANRIVQLERVERGD